MPVLREVVGDTLRGLRLRQSRTLREVSSSARVSLGYLSEVERGQKEPSSELLAAICGALDVELSELFYEVSTQLRREEKVAAASRLAAIPGSGLAGSGLAGAGVAGAGSSRVAPAPSGGAEKASAQLRAVTVAA